jgi:hypothetical protein
MGHEQKQKTWTTLAYLVVFFTLPWVLFILGTALLYAVLSAVHAPTWAWVVFWVYVPIGVLATLLVRLPLKRGTVYDSQTKEAKNRLS